MFKVDGISLLVVVCAHFYAYWPIKCWRGEIRECSTPFVESHPFAQPQLLANFESNETWHDLSDDYRPTWCINPTSLSISILSLFLAYVAPKDSTGYPKDFHKLLYYFKGH